MKEREGGKNRRENAAKEGEMREEGGGRGEKEGKCCERRGNEGRRRREGRKGGKMLRKKGK